MNDDTLIKVLTIAGLIYSIVLHEGAHAVVALWFGDRTAQRLGRVTLNPIPSIDPIGSLLVPIVLLLSNTGIIFGWAKPVPVVPSNYSHRVIGDICVSLAGIATNLAIAFLLMLLLAFGVGQSNLVAKNVMGALAFYNVVLAVFNLIPIPPLDGSHVVKYLLPPRLQEAYTRIGFVGILAVVLLLQLKVVSSFFVAAIYHVQDAILAAAVWVARLF